VKRASGGGDAPMSNRVIGTMAATAERFDIDVLLAFHCGPVPGAGDLPAGPVFRAQS
jgi:hypothetical protein